MSQSTRILAHLKAGESITPLQALEKFGCMRLAARIANLRDDGHVIATEKVTHNGKTFARYRLVA